VTKSFAIKTYIGVGRKPQLRTFGIGDPSYAEQSVDDIKFRTLVDYSSDFIAMIDQFGTVEYLNRTGRSLVGLPIEEDLKIGTIQQILTSKSWKHYKTIVHPTVESTGKWHGELDCWNTSRKRPIRVEATVFVVRDPDSQNTLCYSVVFRDITSRKKLDDQIRMQIGIISMAKAELERKNEQLLQLNAALEKANIGLIELASTDGLTGLNNRHAFELRILEETSRCSRFGKACSVLLLDVDHFKAYNDTYGHLQGDQILREVALILKSQARTIDFVARYGGEEFVFIFPETTADDATVAAERVRRAVEEHAWPLRSITISGGVSTWSQAAPGGWHVVSEADQALYASKSAGRNKIIHAKDLPES
jgi:diguanylate cyclase (GGDEF)-like protein/PAS domain S-box-containing protein